MALLLAVPCAAAAAETGPPLEIVGTAVLPDTVAREAAGRPPRGVANRTRWAARAARRIVGAYKARGYTMARAWSGVLPDGRVLIEVDEGRMSGIVFPGASPREALLFRIDMDLPHDVFHRPTVEKGVEELRAKHRLRSIRWRVVDREEMVENRLGDPVALRGLRIRVLGEDPHGWDVGADLDATFGLVPAVGYFQPNLLMDHDRLRLGLSVGVPYRRYLFDSEPRFTWVHGELSLAYRSGAFAKDRLTFSFEADGILSRYARTDLGFASYFKGLWSTFAGLSWQIVQERLSLELGVGVGSTHVFQVTRHDPDPAAADPFPPERSRFRYMFRLRADLETGRDEGFLGRERRFRLQGLVALTRSGDALVDLSLRGRHEFSFGWHDLLVGVRGLVLAGDVLFWDELPLAGDCQRVFFGNRYWIRRAAQLEVAARFGVWEDRIKVGLFHDLSVFADRTRTKRPVALANGFGPSLHFLILDRFRLDLYYGFGFAPSGFDHNFSLSLRSTF
jgi:hypothetical protein